MTVWNVIGLMSGTSLDGIDAAVLTTDGERVLARGAGLSRPYTAQQRGLLRAALAAGRDLADRMERPAPLAEAERMVTEAHAEAARALMNDPAAGRIDLVGFHGQTVFHAPERHFTVQIGDGGALARALGVPVVSDLRAADVAAGGEGAPFVPVYHRALVEAAGLDLPVAVVNIGGVANVTFIGEGGMLVAADTGPGNALIDDFMEARTGASMDKDGAHALAGRVDAAALARLLDHPYFARPAPKSLDRDAFSAAPVAGLSTDDGAATLTAFTVRTIADAIAALGDVRRLIVSGGGARNPAILKGLAEAVRAPVGTADSLGWSADFMEAEAFAFLAARSRAGLPLSFPGTTGVPVPTTGGVFAAP